MAYSVHGVPINFKNIELFVSSNNLWTRYEKDIEVLQAAFAQQLHCDLSRMYRTNLYTDGQVITSSGCLHFHQSIFEARSPAIWRHCLRIAALQERTGLVRKSSANFNEKLTLHLPDIPHGVIEQFIVSLYQVPKVKELKQLTKCILERLEWLEQLSEIKRRKISLKPVSSSSSQLVEKQIFEQLEEQISDSSHKSLRIRSPLKNLYDGDSLLKRDDANQLNFQQKPLSVDSENLSEQTGLSFVSVSDTSCHLPKKAKNPLEIVDLNTFLQSSCSFVTRKRSDTYTVSKGEKHFAKGKRLCLKRRVELENKDFHLESLCNSNLKKRARRHFYRNFTEDCLADDNFSYRKHVPQKHICLKRHADSDHYESYLPIILKNSAKKRISLKSTMTDHPQTSSISACSTESEDESSRTLENRNLPSQSRKQLEHTVSFNSAPSENTFVQNIPNDFNHSTSFSRPEQVCDTDDAAESGSLNRVSIVGSCLRTTNDSLEVKKVNENGKKKFVKQQSEKAAAETPRLVRTQTFEIINSPRSSVSGCERYASRENEPNFADDYVSCNRDNFNYYQVRDSYAKPVGSETDKELERLKGSFLFEHNFQTFSNIPTSNLMYPAMLSGSLSSESSLGLGSLFGSTPDRSVFSSAVNTQSTEQFMIHSCDPPTVIERKNLNNDLCNVLAKQAKRVSKASDNSSISASPDSLSVDYRMKNMNCDFTESDSLKSGKNDVTNSNILSHNDNDDLLELKNEEALKSEMSIFLPESPMHKDVSESTIVSGAGSDSLPPPEIKSLHRLASDDGSSNASPREIRRAEHIPIVSGGSTLKREISSDEKPGRDLEQYRQNGSGTCKDVDSIPLICGYVGSPIEDLEQKEKEINKKKESKQIFSMFIDINDIPSPSNGERQQVAAESDKQHSVFMYIEADSVTDKSKRKLSQCGSFSSKLTGHPSIAVTASVVGPKQKSVEVKPIEELEPIPISTNIDVPSNEKEASLDKKGFFMFIAADTPSNPGSPKPSRKRMFCHQKYKEDSSVMSKSAPSYVLLKGTKSSEGEVLGKFCKSFLTGDELMTKSVIDRKEFMEQPATKRNVSLNENINVSSPRKKKGEFVSGIPRPIYLLKSASKVSVHVATKGRPDNHRQNALNSTNSKHFATDSAESETKQGKVEDRSVCELSPDLCSSLSESLQGIPSLSFPVTDSSSDVRGLLNSLPSHTGNRTEINGSLGKELLNMFEQEIRTDVVVQVGNSRFKAHKCILASRCVYFAALLSGHQTSNVIKLPGFSSDAVLLALRHIYSGDTELPSHVSAKEAAAIADMLSLDGLKTVVALHLKAEKCHYFHKPCVGGCIEGVLDTLTVCATYSLEELYSKCLRWLAKYFVAVLPTKQFAQLAHDLQERVILQISHDMTVDTVLDTIMGSGQVQGSLPIVRWSQHTLTLCSQLLVSASSFAASHLGDIFESDKLVLACKMSSKNVEEALVSACRQVTAPEQAVLALTHISNFLEKHHNEQEIQETLTKLAAELESFLAHNLSRASVCKQWPLLPRPLQKKIRQFAPAALHTNRFSSAPAPHRPRLGSLGSKPVSENTDLTGPQKKIPVDYQKLARSSSASAVGPTLGCSNRTALTTVQPLRNKPLSLSTPPPTRASTLRARQAAVIKASVNKRSNTSSFQESHSPRAQQRVSVRPLTPSSKSTSRPITPAHQQHLHRTSQATQPTCDLLVSNEKRSESSNNNKEQANDSQHNSNDVDELPIHPHALTIRSRTFLKDN